MTGLTLETARFLRALMETVSLKPTAPDFPQVAEAAAQAVAELDAAVVALEAEAAKAPGAGQG